ncbi:hypothetical protein D3C76_730740 [compost metagenome]
MLAHLVDGAARDVDGGVASLGQRGVVGGRLRHQAVQVLAGTVALEDLRFLFQLEVVAQQFLDVAEQLRYVVQRLVGDRHPHRDLLHAVGYGLEGHVAGGFESAFSHRRRAAGMQQLAEVAVALPAHRNGGEQVADTQFLADARLDGRVIVRRHDTSTGDLGFLHGCQVGLDHLDLGTSGGLLLQALVAVVSLDQVNEGLAFARLVTQLDALLLQILNLVDDLLQLILLRLNILLQLGGDGVALLHLGDGRIVLGLQALEALFQLQLQGVFQFFHFAHGVAPKWVVNRVEMSFSSSTIAVASLPPSRRSAG